MKGKVLILILFWLCSENIAFSQNTDRTWVVGSQSPIYMALKFDINGLDSIVTPQHMEFFHTSASVSDSIGDLIFYTNGNYLENRNYQRMQNSTNFNPSFVNNSSHGLNIDGGAIVIPYPSHLDLFYLFHVNYEEFVKNNHTYDNPLELRYSNVDMNLDGGLGDIDPTHKTVPIVNDTLVLGRLMACRHANGRDWWLLAHRFQNNTFYKLLITPDTIITTLQNIGNNVSAYTPVGFSLFNQTGDKFAVMQSDTIVDLYDFDRCSGQLSNYTPLYIHDTLSALTGMALSASGRFLFVSSLSFVFQYDLQAADVYNSRIVIATVDTNITYLGQVLWFSNMKLAPDNKIYINTWNGTPYIHVINFPDRLGLSCNLVQHAIRLSQWNILTFPTTPNYSMGALTGSICDSLTNEVLNVSADINTLLFPNPAHDKFSIRSTYNGTLKVNLSDQLGKILIKQKINNNESIDVSSLQSGVYFLEINYGEERVVKKLIVTH